MKIKSIAETIPVLGFEEDVLISRNLDMTVGMRLQLPELFACGEDRLYAMHDTFRRILAMLPAGTLLHRQDYFLEKPFDGEEQLEATSATSFLTRSYLRHFKGRSHCGTRPIFLYPCSIWD